VARAPGDCRLLNVGHRQSNRAHFALVHFYGLRRTTGDVDYYTAIPNDVDLEGMAGKHSPLHAKYKIYLQHVAVVALPEDHESRLRVMTEGQFKKLKLHVPDPYDLILSKLQRASQKDPDDANYLFKDHKLNSQTLRARYTNELRAGLDRHDGTFERWIEIFETAD
jgi:Nucleotidyltransferase of unknown function (DUF6036)